ncbi:MAG: prepilin peptidase [Candidatus Moranbacteria bacterium]|nr:prepilin peptidase [Candidatus Moranbacteria bacterium]
MSLILGLVIGSFLNVVIFRTEKDMTFGGRSFCPKCKKKIVWYDNIPLLSFLWLGGRCRHCKKKIHWSYPAVEMATSLLFLLSAFLVMSGGLNGFLSHYGTVAGLLELFNQPPTLVNLHRLSFITTLIELVFLWSVFATAFAVFVYDLKYMLIPDSFTWMAIKIVAVFNIVSDSLLMVSVFSNKNQDLLMSVAGFANEKIVLGFTWLSDFFGLEEKNFLDKIIYLKSLSGRYESTVVEGSMLQNYFIDSSVGKFINFILETRTGSGLIVGLILALIFFAIVYFSNETWMGMGDVKLVFFIGFFLGMIKGWLAIFLAFELGAIFGITLIIIGRAKMKTALPFGPFLIAGMLLALFIH